MTDKTDTTISVREFRMWLQGVEEMQDAGWTPTTQQWAKIREKIDSIRDMAIPETPVNIQMSPTFVNPNVRAPGLATHEQVVIPAGPSNLNYTPEPTFINPLLAGSGGQIKTPDIDTSNGGYRSGFA